MSDIYDDSDDYSDLLYPPTEEEIQRLRSAPLQDDPDPMQSLRDHSQRNIDAGTIAYDEEGRAATVRSGSVSHPGLNQGRTTLIPFQWEGSILNPEEATERAIASGRQWPSFDTPEEATAASKELSASIRPPASLSDLEAQDQEYMDAKGALDQVDSRRSDLWKSAKGGLVRAGANYVLGREREQRLEDAEDLQRLKDTRAAGGSALVSLTDDQMADLDAEIERREIDIAEGRYGQGGRSFWYSFMQPILQKTGAVAPDESVGERIKRWEQGIMESRTEEAVEKAEKPFFNPDHDPRDTSTWFEGTAMPWEDWEAFSLHMAANAPDIAISLGANVLGARTGRGAVARAMQKDGVIDPDTIRAAAQKAGTRAGAIAGTSTEYIQIRDAVANELHESLEAQFGDDAMWQDNEKYQQLREEGLTDFEAKELLRDQTARMGGMVAGAVSSIMGVPMERTLAKIGLGDAAKTRVGNIFLGASGEALTEGVQESTEQLISNIYESQINPSKPYSDDLMNAFFGGAVMGGAFGGTFGAVSPTDPGKRAGLNKETRELLDAGWREWKKHGNERSELQATVSQPDYLNAANPTEAYQNYLKLEDLELKEADAWLAMEPTLRKIQSNRNAGVGERRRADNMAARYKITKARIEAAREERGDAARQAATEAYRAEQREKMVTQVAEDESRLAEARQNLTDIQTIQEGGVLEDEQSYNRLIDEGYGRWRDKLQTKFVLTPAGRAAPAALESTVANLEGKIEAGYAGQDRRQDLAQREADEQLSDEEFEKKHLRDPVMGLLNRRSWEDSEQEQGPGKAYLSVDVDSLGFVNDYMGGHEAGDRYLKRVARAARAVGLGDRVYRLGGDELAIRGESQEELEVAGQQIQEWLDTHEPVKMPDGRSITPQITWGSGTTFDEADQALVERKREKEEAGLRPKKGTGQEPPSIIDPDAPEQLGLFSRDDPEQGSRALRLLSLEIGKIWSSQDEFSVRRRAELIKKFNELRLQQSYEHVAKVAERTMAETGTPKTEAQLTSEYQELTSEVRAIYDERASGFYSVLAGQDITGAQAYVFERKMRDLRSIYWPEWMPSFNLDQNGNMVDVGHSQVYDTVDRIIGEGRLPDNLMRHLRQEQAQWQQQGYSDIKLADMLVPRVEAFVEYESAAGGPHPFSNDVDGHLEIAKQFEEGLYPDLLSLARPSGFHRGLAQGDTVEVTTHENERRVGRVIRSDKESVVVQWEGKPNVVDPDLGRLGNQARFDRDTGFQISTRGPRPYRRQVGWLPQQARLGRRLVEGKWKTQRDVHAATTRQERRVELSRLPDDLRTVSRQNRATAREAQHIAQIAGIVTAGFNNLPPIRVARSIADLPPRLIAKIQRLGSQSSHVDGMMDEQTGDVWIVAGNLLNTHADHASKPPPPPTDETIMSLASGKSRSQAYQENFKTWVEYERGGELRVGLDTANTPAEAAHIIAPLRKRAQENLVAVVTDKNGKVLEVQQHTVGSIDAASAYPAYLAGGVLGVEGAANVWLAHNHPSGSVDQSAADRGLTDRFSVLMQNTGVDVKGMLTTGPGERFAGFYPPGGTSTTLERIEPAPRKKDVGLLTRTIKRREKTPAVTSASDVKEYLSKHHAMQDGVLLLDNRHRVAGFVPMSASDMLKLRGARPGKMTPKAELLAAFHHANARAAIAHIALTPDRPGDYDPAVANLGAFLRQTNNVELVDAIVEDASLQSHGNMPDGGEAYMSYDPAQKIRDLDLPRVVTEVVMHEVVGHYGLRGLMGNSTALDRFMDEFSMAFPKETLEKAMEYGFAYTKKNGQVAYRSDAMRRMAAEESFAYLAQKVMADQVRLDPPQRTALQRIVDAIKDWMIRNGFGRFVGKMTNNDVYRLMTRAQAFVENGSGWRFQQRTGRALTPYMRDSEMFRSNMLYELHDGTRPPTKQEAAQDREQGYEVADRSYFQEAHSRGEWIARWNGLIKQGRVKEVEVEDSGLMEFLENITFEDFLQYGGREVLPAHMQELLALADPAGAGLLMDPLPRLPDNDAVADFAEALTRDKVGKKTKIPFDVVAGYLQDNSYKVEVRSPFGYQIATQEADKLLREAEREGGPEARRKMADEMARDPDINPYNFTDIRPPQVMHDNLWTVGVEPSSRRELIFKSVRPARQEEYGHFGSPRGVFMHQRGGIVREVDTDERMWMLVEAQSDSFQGKEQADMPTSVSAADQMIAQVNRMDDALASGMTTLTGRIVDDFLDGVVEDLERAIDNDLLIAAGPRDDPDYNQSRRELLNEWINNYLRDRAIPIGDMETHFANELHALGPIEIKDDVRLQQSEDMRTAREFAEIARLALTEGLLAAGSFDPTGVTGTYDELSESEQWRPRARARMQRSFHSRLMSNARLDPRFLARVYGNRKIALEILEGLGYSPDDAKRIYSESAVALQSSTVDVSPTMVRRLYEAAAPVPTAGYPSLESLFNHYGDRLRGLGFEPRNFIIVDTPEQTHGPRGKTVTAVGSVPIAGVQFGDAIKFVFDEYLKDLNAHWDRQEQLRIERMQKRAEVQSLTQEMDEATGERKFPGDPIGAVQELSLNDDLEWAEESLGEGRMFTSAEEWVDARIESAIEAIWEDGTMYEYLEEFELEDSDGNRLDYDNPDFRNMIEIRGWEEVDATAAFNWLQEQHSERMWEEFHHTDGEGYRMVRDDLMGEAPDDLTEVMTWRIPTALDEDGVVSDYQRVMAVQNEMDPDDGSVDTDWNVYTEDDTDSWLESFSELSEVQDWIADYAFNMLSSKDLRDKVPETSVFYPHVLGGQPVKAETPELTPEQKQGLEPRPIPPEVNDLANAVKLMTPVTQIERMGGPGEVVASRDRMSMLLNEVSSKGFVEESPWRKNSGWRVLQVKAAIMQAIRAGANKVVWQSGEANASRGGWGGAGHDAWTREKSISYKKRTITVAGREVEAYDVRTASGAHYLLPEDKLVTTLGLDVATMMTTKDVDPEAMQRDLSRSLVLHQLGSGEWIVFDQNEREMVGNRAYSEKATAEIVRSERMREILASTGNRGMITEEMMGGPIAVAPDYKKRSSWDVRGARVGYDIALRRTIGRYIKQFGGEISESKIGVPLSEERAAVMGEGQRLTYEVSENWNALYPNLRIDQLPSDYTGQSGFVLISDNGLFETMVYRSYGDAADRLTEVLEDESRRSVGIKVNSFEITPEMRKYFEEGGVPLLSKKTIKGNPALESMASKIGAEAERKPFWKIIADLRTDWQDRWQQGIFDKFYGIRRALEDAGLNISDGYIQTRLSTSLDSQMRAVLKYGPLEWVDGVAKIAKDGKGLANILQQVQGLEQEWGQYMVARRAQRLKKEDREKLFTDDEINEALEWVNEYPHFQRVADEYAEFNKAILDFAEQAGVIDSETRPMWENADYIPFYRVRDDVALANSPIGMNTQQSIANQKKQIQRLRGTTKKMGDPIKNILTNVSNMIDSAMKNHAAKTVVDSLQGTGLMVKAAWPGRTALIPETALKKKLIEVGIDPTKVPPDALKGLHSMFAVEPPSGPGVVSILRDGKREYYRTDDELLYQSMTLINQQFFGKWMNFLRNPKRWLTVGVTLDPGFMVRNFSRDLLSAFVLGRDALMLPRHIIRAAKGFGSALVEGKDMQALLGSGAAFSTGHIDMADARAAQRTVDQAMRKKGIRVLVNPKQWLRAYMRLGTAFENANRLAVYNAAKAAGKNELQAAYEAKDLMDFSMSGSWPAIQILIQTVPFMGARLQGLHRLGRGAKENPIGFSMKTMLVTMAGLVLWMAFREDERYKKLSQYQKDLYYNWWIGDEHYALPKPFEIGAIGTLFERGLEFALSEEDDAGKLLAQRLFFMIHETFAINVIPHAFMPLIESAANHNFFSGGRITSDYQKALPPEMDRYYTGYTSRLVGQSLPRQLDGVTDRIRSPAHIEHVFKGYTGTVGRYALMTADKLLGDLMGQPPTPDWQPGQRPVLGSFFKGDAPPRTNYEETYYDVLDKVMRVEGSISDLQRAALPAEDTNGAPIRGMTTEERITEIEADYVDYIEVADEFKDANKQIRKLNKDIRDIYIDEEMTPEEKRIETDQILEEKNEIFEELFHLRPGGRDNPFGEDFPGSGRAALEAVMESIARSDRPAELLRERAPTTASLVQDVLQNEELGTLVK